MNIIQKYLAIGLATVGMGCGAATLPPEQMSATQASLRAAQELGAQNVPKADLQLRLAIEGVAQAQKLAEDGDEELAKMQLDRAKADAELAVALARQATAQNNLDEITKGDMAAAVPTVQVPPAAQAER
jgi:predicted negative regulator of RcsB-dependent stress response